MLSAEHNVSVPLQDPTALWEKPEFNRDNPLVIFVTGWTTNFNETNDALSTMHKAYECRGATNFVVSQLLIIWVYMHFQFLFSKYVLDDSVYN